MERNELNSHTDRYRSVVARRDWLVQDGRSESLVQHGQSRDQRLNRGQRLLRQHELSVPRRVRSVRSHALLGGALLRRWRVTLRDGRALDSEFVVVGLDVSGDLQRLHSYELHVGYSLRLSAKGGHNECLP